MGNFYMEKAFLIRSVLRVVLKEERVEKLQTKFGVMQGRDKYVQL